MEILIWQQDWFLWAVALSIGFPILIIVLGEIIHRLQKDGKPLEETLRIVRNFVLPVSVLMLFIKNVLEFDPDGNLVKIIETCFWVCVILAALSLINAILFAEAKADTWRARVPKMLIDLSRLLLVLLGIAIVLALVWDADLAGVFTALGVGSLVLGLALQDTLGSIISGIALLFARPFTVGDWLEIEDFVGQVIDLNWRGVYLLTRERDMIVIPHKFIGGQIVRNYSKPLQVHIESFEIDFPSSDPPNLVKQVLKSTALATEGVLPHPEPEIRVVNYVDYKGIYEVRFSIEDYQAAPRIRDRLITRIWYAADRNNLEATSPIYRIDRVDNSTSVADTTSRKFAESLHSIPVFVPLAKEHHNLDELAKGAVLEHFGAGEVVVYEGDPGRALYIIIAGHALVTVKNKDGEQQKVIDLSRGEFFGEMALFSGQPSKISVTAIEDLEVIKISSDAVNTMLDRQPTLGREIGQIIEARRKEILVAQEGDIVSDSKDEVVSRKSELNHQ